MRDARVQDCAGPCGRPVASSSSKWIRVAPVGGPLHASWQTASRVSLPGRVRLMVVGSRCTWASCCWVTGISDPHVLALPRLASEPGTGS